MKQNLRMKHVATVMEMGACVADRWVTCSLLNHQKNVITAVEKDATVAHIPVGRVRLRRSR